MATGDVPSLVEQDPHTSSELQGPDPMGRGLNRTVRFGPTCISFDIGRPRILQPGLDSRKKGANARWYLSTEEILPFAGGCWRQKLKPSLVEMPPPVFRTQTTGMFQLHREDQRWLLKWLGNSFLWRASSMIKSSPVLATKPSTGQMSPATSWADIAMAREVHRRPHRAAEEASTAGQDSMLQALMRELTRGKPGIRPEEPLRVVSEEALQSWILEAWTFEGFHVVKVASARAGASCEGRTTRYEFIPMALR